MEIKSSISSYFEETTDAASLAVFRILFGLIMFIGLVRFAANGWIDKLYIKPEFFFSYYGFSWVKPIGEATYLLFIICGICALGIMLGWKYKWSITGFFLTFTYIELMDKTTYLNHYYFISLMSFLLIWLPAHRYYSVDAFINKDFRRQFIPKWTLNSVQLLLAIVYIYAGLAKLNSDWLINALPLKIWLTGSYDVPVIGRLLEQNWVAYAFSWGGMIYDLTIVFLLLWNRTRVFGFILVIVFHLLTWILFPIGMFPFIMIASSVIFLSSGTHRKVLDFISSVIRLPREIFDNGKSLAFTSMPFSTLKMSIIGFFFILQLLIPFRYLLYPGNLYWTEEGYRFSWRVMLMEKAGTATFKIVDGVSGKRFYVNNRDFLSSFQEKQMNTQPDFILEYAHYLEDIFSNQGHDNIEVYVESFVTLNGALSQTYIDPNIDLTKVVDSWGHRDWVLDYNKNNVN